MSHTPSDTDEIPIVNKITDKMVSQAIEASKKAISGDVLGDFNSLIQRRKEIEEEPNDDVQKPSTSTATDEPYTRARQDILQEWDDRDDEIPGAENIPHADDPRDPGLIVHESLQDLKPPNRADQIYGMADPEALGRLISKISAGGAPNIREGPSTITSYNTTSPPPEHHEEFSDEEGEEEKPAPSDNDRFKRSLSTAKNMMEGFNRGELTSPFDEVLDCVFAKIREDIREGGEENFDRVTTAIRSSLDCWQMMLLRHTSGLATVYDLVAKTQNTIAEGFARIDRQQQYLVRRVDLMDNTLKTIESSHSMHAQAIASQVANMQDIKDTVVSIQAGMSSVTTSMVKVSGAINNMGSIVNTKVNAPKLVAEPSVNLQRTDQIETKYNRAFDIVFSTQIQDQLQWSKPLQDDLLYYIQHRSHAGLMHLINSHFKSILSDSPLIMQFAELKYNTADTTPFITIIQRMIHHEAEHGKKVPRVTKTTTSDVERQSQSAKRDVRKKGAFSMDDF